MQIDLFVFYETFALKDVGNIDMLISLNMTCFNRDNEYWKQSIFSADFFKD